MFLPNDIADLILLFLPDYELLEWIDRICLSWPHVCTNPNAIDLLQQNQDKIDWDYLSANPAAIHLLTPNQLDFVIPKFSRHTFIGRKQT